MLHSDYLMYLKSAKAWNSYESVWFLIHNPSYICLATEWNMARTEELCRLCNVEMNNF
jgi:hypothetical protein